MQREQEVPGLVYTRRQEGRATDIGAQSLHKAAMRLADVGRAGSRFKTKDLVGFLLSHGARSWRASLPRTDVRLSVYAPGGEPALKIRLK